MVGISDCLALPGTEMAARVWVGHFVKTMVDIDQGLHLRLAVRQQ